MKIAVREGRKSHFHVAGGFSVLSCNSKLTFTLFTRGFLCGQYRWPSVPLVDASRLAGSREKNRILIPSGLLFGQHSRFLGQIAFKFESDARIYVFRAPSSYRVQQGGRHDAFPTQLFFFFFFNNVFSNLPRVSALFM